MVEVDNGESHQTSGELKQELLDYLKDADFGTPKFLALGDFLNLQRLEEGRSGGIDRAEKQTTDIHSKLFVESNMRIEEMQIALLKHKIENNRSAIQGYGPVYTHLDGSTDDILIRLLNDLWEEYFKRSE